MFVAEAAECKRDMCGNSRLPETNDRFRETNDRMPEPLRIRIWRALYSGQQSVGATAQLLERFSALTHPHSGQRSGVARRS
jgi:hypothetical protein